MVGWSDVPADLSDTAQIARLSAALPEAPVISSTLMRAVDTASALQGTRPRLPHDADLRELNFGDWELQDATDLYAVDPDAVMAYWNDPENNRPPNGESWTDLATRVNRAVDRIIMDHPFGDVIIVAHFGVILTQVRRALDISVKEVMGNRIENLSLTQIKHENGTWQAGKINHLP